MAAVKWIWNKWMDRNIQFKFFITYMVLAVLPLSLFGTASYIIAVHTLQDKAYSSFSVITNQVNHNIDAYLKTVDNMTIVPFFNQSIYENLLIAPGPNGANSDKDLQIEAGIENYFVSLQEIEEGIKAIYIVTENGRVYGHAMNSSMRPENTVAQENWYKEAISRQGGLVISGLRDESQMYASSDNKVVSLARYATYVGTNKKLGVFVIDIDPYIFNFASREPKEGYVVISDQYGNILHSTLDISKQEVAALRGQGKSFGPLQQTVKLTNSRGSYIGVSSTSDYSGWSITYLVATKQLYKDLSKIRQIALSLVAVLLLLSVMIAGFVAKGIALPIKRLSNLMDKVQHGDLNIKVPMRNRDEIGLLSNSFKSMLEELKLSMEQISIQERNKRKAEIEMLRAQINPHFIYNTLSAIRMMAIMQNAQEIARALEIFIQLMKYCTRSDRKWVTLAEEIRFIQDYVALLESRYLRRFSVVYSFEDGVQERLEQALIMPFIIQPLVENAIFHGTGDNRNEIRIEIRQGSNSDLFIAIIDLGKGMDPEQATRLIRSSVHSSGNLSGTGIKNIHERISLEFGEPYGITIQSGLGAGTTVTLRLPWIEEEMAQ